MRQKTFTYIPHWESEIPKVGDEVVLVEITNNLKGWIKWEPRVAPEGIPGNMDSKVKRFHGWRGTTDDVAIYAHGLRQVTKITPAGVIDGSQAYKVTVGKDLHPEWD